MPQRSFLAFSGSNDRAVFAMLRAFDACQAECFVVARGNDDRILQSHYRSWVSCVRPRDELTPEVFEASVAKVRERAGGAELVILPSSEYLNTFLLALGQDRLAALGCDVPLVDRDLYQRVSDKKSSTRLFDAAGIRVPREMDPAADCPLPLVAKPVSNVGPDGLIRYPLLLQTEQEFDAFRARPDAQEYFVQEFIAGRSEYLLAYIAHSGDVFLGAQTNLGQQPHGKSIVMARTSCFHRDPAARKTIELLVKLGYLGLVMVEFIVDAQGPCFIEVNPRPWGPLQLCLDSATGIVESFIGDALYRDPWRYQDLWSRKPEQARYLWAGGIAQVLSRGEKLRWEASLPLRFAQLLASAGSDVYLRRDSWKVFLREMAGK